VSPYAAIGILKIIPGIDQETALPNLSSHANGRFSMSVKEIDNSPTPKGSFAIRFQRINMVETTPPTPQSDCSRSSETQGLPSIAPAVQPLADVLFQVSDHAASKEGP
jgi:hypothetical protein